VLGAPAPGRTTARASKRDSAARLARRA